MSLDPDTDATLELLGVDLSATFGDMFAMMTKWDASAMAAEDSDRAYTYSELLSMISGVADLLKKLGVRAGDRVASISPGDIRVVVTNLAVLLTGAVLVPIGKEYQGYVLRRTLIRLQVKAVLAHPEIFDQVLSAASGLDIEHVLSTGSMEYLEAMNHGGSVAAHLAEYDRRQGDPGFILPTSGTTGEPKGVVLPQNWCLLGPLAFRKQGQGLKGGPKYYICLSWGHGVPLMQLETAFWLGGSAVIAKGFSASGFWDDVDAHHCTHAFGMSTMLRMLYNTDLRDRSDKPHLDMITSGLPGDMWEGFVGRYNVSVHEQYGATDLCRDPEKNWLMNPGQYPVGSVGRPMPRLDVRLVDDEMKDVSVGQSGQLVARPNGSEAVVEYYNDPEASRAKVHDGWSLSGDLFRRDEEGNFWYVGRQTESIRRNAMNISPVEVERTLVAIPGVRTTIVFAVPSELAEDEIKAAVIVSNPELTADAVAEAARPLVPRHMMPRYFEIVDSIPMTGSGKAQRFMMREGWRTPTTWDAREGAYLDLADA